MIDRQKPKTREIYLTYAIAKIDGTQQKYSSDEEFVWNKL